MKSSHRLGAFFLLLALLFSLTLLRAAAAPAWSDYRQKPDAWYRDEAGMSVTANILSWQSAEGSWPKNTNTTVKPFTGDPQKIQGTFDNGATLGELRFLARNFRVTKDPRHEQAFLKGLDAILKAQYPTGGWPQYYPPGKQYHRHITFNDGTMVHLMEFLREVATTPDYEFVSAERRQSAQAGFDRGLQCILKCQIKVAGKLTVWCAQHDEIDYSPRPARSYELVSLSGSESVGILHLLMSLDRPTPETARSIQAGAAWFESAKITGLRQTKVSGNKIMIKDPAAPSLWARFYEIETGRPIFSGRDGVKKYDVSEIEAERRNGYAWYGEWGSAVAKDFASWKEKHKP